jgi:hypothetical protein
MNLAKITRLARQRYRQIFGGNAPPVAKDVPLICYLAESDYRQVVGDTELADLTFFEHWATLALLGEMFKKGGVRVIFTPLFPDDYFRWLKKNRFENSPQSRSRYAIWLTTGRLNELSFQRDF